MIMQILVNFAVENVQWSTRLLEIHIQEVIETAPMLATGWIHIHLFSMVAIFSLSFLR